ELRRLLDRAGERARGPRPASRRRVPRVRDHPSGRARLGDGHRADRRLFCVGAGTGVRDDGDGLARHEPPLVALLAEARLPHELPAPAPAHRLTRLALLADSKLAIVNAREDAVVLAPPPPRDPVADVAAGVRDSLRFPLAGEPRDALVSRGARATVVVDLPAQPVPQTPIDPRPQALAAALEELERAGVPSEQTTILVAGGLARRAGRREIDQLVLPEVRRRFRGSFEVHD